MGNQETSKIMGIGNVILETNTDCKILLKDVRHVPDMHLNRISAGKLDDAGYMNLFGGGKWKLTINNMIIARGNKQGCLYVTQGKLSKGETNVACGNSCLELWHKRLGHISEKGLQILAQKALILEVKGKAIQPCIHYLAGKQHKVSFRRDPVPVIRHETIEEQNAENQDENNDSPTDESSTEANEDQPIETIEPEVVPEPEITPQSELRRSVR
ncbi:hypothetical protein V6N12_009846 [Hibiscus sabdariffa]|uniref:GAG-pre-integrase domain-containing protein n=1 Tax=Hibiscus sabdariffa TaxID=183260 RepID=A0ABR2EBX5_9ROSI